LKSISYYLAVIVLFTSQLWATNTNPVVTNVTFNISGTTVTVHYDVTDLEQSSVTIKMEVSNDNGFTWTYNFGTASGDVGNNVGVGTGKTITWTYTGTYNQNFKIRIYANDETADGSPCAGIPTVLYSGKTYNTVQIGDQCWLKENLDVGTRINGVVDQSNNGIIEKYCANDLVANCVTYGGLYQWAEAVQYLNGATNTTSPNPSFSSNVQGICPDGWHVPSFVEAQDLCKVVNNINNPLKSFGIGINPGIGTNTSGFSALFSGYRVNSGNFGNFGTSSLFWFSTEGSNASNGTSLSLFYGNNSTSLMNLNTKIFGFSIRCLKN
jgi:uncharacterized protein (TIGR02145 family)